MSRFSVFNGIIGQTGSPVDGSIYGKAVPIVYGRNRITPCPILAPDALWSVREGYKDGTPIRLYRQGLELALCEGPIIGTGRIWRDQDVFADLAAFNAGNPYSDALELFTGARPQSAWSYLTGSTSDTRSAWYTVPETGPFSFEVDDDTFGTDWVLVEGPTLSWAPGLSIVGEYVLVETITDIRQYTRSGNILTFSSAIHGQPVRVVWGVATDLGALSAGYSGTALLASSGLELGESNSIPTLSVEVSGFYGTSGAANPADIISDFLADTNYGAGIPSAMVDVEYGPDPGGATTASGLRNWCAQTAQLLSPVFSDQQATSEHIGWILDSIGATVIWSEGKFKFRPLGESTVGTYVPYSTARYDLTIAHFITDDGQAPVEISHTTIDDQCNTVDVNYLEGDPASGLGVYSKSVQSYSDATDVTARGVVKGPQVDAPCITSGPQARRLAEFLVTRNLRKTALYRFTLGSRFICLEPGDIVTLTEAGTGLDHTAVVIRSKQESSDQRLTFEAEAWLGLAHPALTEVETGHLDGFDTQAPAYETNPPALALSADNRTAFVGASGASKDFGSAEVWTSWDNSTFVYRGRSGATCHGQITDALAAGSAFDETNELAIDVAACGRDLPAVSSVASGLCLVGSEILTYDVATSTGTRTYDLTDLHRGIQGSWSAAHSIGAGFLLLDANVLQLDVAGHEGGTLYVKLVPHNAAGIQTGTLTSAISWALPIPAARPLVARLPWSDTFDEFDLSDWELLRTGGVLSVQQSGAAGGSVLRCEGETWLMSRQLVPVELAKILALRCRYRQVTAGTYSRFSVGFIGVGADGQTLVGKDGTATGEEFWALENNAGTPGTWVDVTRFWADSDSTGEDGSSDITDPAVFHDDVRWVRVVIGFNDGCGATGVQEIDGLWLSEAVSGALVVPFSVPESVYGDASISARTIQADAIRANHIQAGEITVDRLTAGQISDNLFPNGNAEATAPAGALTTNPVTIDSLYCDLAAEYGWIASTNGGDAAYSGTKFRAKTADVGHQENLVKLVPCAPGDSLYIQAMCRSTTGSGNVGVYLTFLDASGATTGNGDSTKWPAYYTASATWTLCRIGGTAPAGTVACMLRLFVNTGAAGRWDSIYARKMVSAALLSDLIFQRYSMTLTDSAKNATITLSPAQPDTNYAVVATVVDYTVAPPVPADTLIYFISKGTTSMTLYAANYAQTGRTVTYDVVLIRSPEV